MATISTITWFPVALVVLAPGPLPCTWLPVTSGPWPRPRACAWEPVTRPAPVPLPACMIVLARETDFGTDAHGNQVWLPLSRGQFGTAAATREIGWGTVLSVSKSKRAPTEAKADDIGLLLAGTVGDQTATVTLHCDISMMDPADEPNTGDLFTYEGLTYCIFSVDPQSEHDGDKEMTVSGIRWNGCSRQTTPAGITPPANWT